MIFNYLDHLKEKMLLSYTNEKLLNMYDVEMINFFIDQKYL